VNVRVKDGDDASCLNLNRAQQPRLLGLNPEQLQLRKAFSFTKTLSNGDVNGWDLLSLNTDSNVIPAVGDEATVRWGLANQLEMK